MGLESNHSLTCRQLDEIETKNSPLHSLYTLLLTIQTQTHRCVGTDGSVLFVVSPPGLLNSLIYEEVGNHTLVAKKMSPLHPRRRHDQRLRAD
jgi:hypothetical protein